MTAPEKAPVLFGDIASASARVASTRSRLQKKRFLVDFLSRVPADEMAAVVGWLVEEPLCGPLGVGPAQLWELSHEAPREEVSQAPLTLREVEDTLSPVRGSGREAALASVAFVFQRLSKAERELFVGALTGSLRQGSLGGLMLLALADLSGRHESDVRRAVMVTGSIASAARALLGPGEHAVPPTALELFRPLAPMLATSAESLEEALGGLSDALVEWKVDGVRAQVHKQGDRIAIYSRQGNDITAGCLTVARELAALRTDQAVLDGEIVLVGPDGAPRPFQDSFSAIASGAVPREGDRLRVVLFDCLHLDGIDLVDQPLWSRLEALRAIAPAHLCMPSVRGASIDQAKTFYADALSGGHEGVMVKNLASLYRLGARGRAWQKVKEFVSVDLVVLAAEWGSGRRQGFLSNLHLGARQEDGGFCMVGKTFKGLTDAMLSWQTARLEELATERTQHVVRVEPRLVVEIRFNDVQRSPRYPGGIALRFARVVRYREDKLASEVEPLAALLGRLPEPMATSPGQRRPRKARQRGSSEKEQREKQQLSLFEK